MGLLIIIYIQRERMRLFGATVKEITRHWWPQVHK